MKFWTIQAFQEKVKIKNEIQGDYRMSELAIIHVHADNEKEALKQAKKVLKRKYYRVYEVWDEEQNHEFNEDFKIAQLELQAKMLKKIS